MGDPRSLMQDLLDEVCGPAVIEVGDHRWDASAPHGEWVAGLDDCRDVDGALVAYDVVDELLGQVVTPGTDDAAEVALADVVLGVLDGFQTTETERVAARLLAHWHLDRTPPLGWAELVWRIDSHGAAIEADLPEVWPGIEITDWIAGRRPWRELYRRLQQLPPGSRWVASIAGDEDLARAQIEHDADTDAPEPDTDPGLVGETQERQLLRLIADRVGDMIFMLRAVNTPKGKSPGRRPEPLPRPRTGRDLVMADSGMDDVMDIFDQVDPGWRERHGYDAPRVPGDERITEQRPSGLWTP